MEVCFSASLQQGSRESMTIYQNFFKDAIANSFAAQGLVLL